MGCLLVLFAAFAPRLIVVFAWIARPAYFGAVFDTWIFPLLGLIFLPFTTLIWLLVGAPPQGVEGLDWLWVVLAVLLDLSHYANTYEQRDTVSAGMGSCSCPLKRSSNTTKLWIAPRKARAMISGSCRRIRPARASASKKPDIFASVRS